MSVFVSRLGDLFIQIPLVLFDTGMVGNGRGEMIYAQGTK
jgi:hypothetical protein